MDAGELLPTSNRTKDLPEVLGSQERHIRNKMGFDEFHDQGIAKNISLCYNAWHLDKTLGFSFLRLGN